MYVTIPQWTDFIQAIASFVIAGCTVYSAFAIRTVKHATNSMMHERLQETEEAAHAKGVLDEKERVAPFIDKVNDASH